MAELNPITTWLIELEGYRTDLCAWRRFFQDRTIAAVELSPGRDGESAYFVHSQRLDGIPDTEAHKSAEELIAEMNGAVALCGGPRARMSWLWFVGSGGKAEPLKEVTADGGVPVSWLAGVSTEAEPDQSATRPEQRAWRAMKIAGCVDQVAAALRHFGTPLNWYDLWTTFEIIEEGLWESTAHNDRPKRDKKKNVSARRILLGNRQWVPDDDLRMFSESCNYHRHGKRRPPTCWQTASLDQAQRVLGQILQGWLEEKSLQHSSTL